MANDSTNPREPQRVEPDTKEDIREIDGIPVEKWYLAPILIPTELKEEISAVANDADMALTEFVLCAALAAAGYNDKTVEAARRLCYPKGKRTEPAAQSVKATEAETTNQKKKE